MNNNVRAPSSHERNKRIEIVLPYDARCNSCRGHVSLFSLTRDTGPPLSHLSSFSSVPKQIPSKRTRKYRNTRTKARKIELRRFEEVEKFPDRLLTILINPRRIIREATTILVLCNRAAWSKSLLVLLNLGRRMERTKVEKERGRRGRLSGLWAYVIPRAREKERV